MFTTLSDTAGEPASAFLYLSHEAIVYLTLSEALRPVGQVQMHGRGITLCVSKPEDLVAVPEEGLAQPCVNPRNG